MARAGPIAALPPPTALAVVDGPAWAALLDRVLQAHGFRTHRVTREAAPAMLAAWPYDLVVVTDPSRDGLDAFALVRWLRDDDRGAGGTRCATVLVLSPGLTDKGRQYLAHQASPRQVLEDFVRVLEDRQAAVAELSAATARMAAGLESLRTTVEQVIPRLTDHHQTNGTPMNAIFIPARPSAPAASDALIADVKARAFASDRPA